MIRKSFAKTHIKLAVLIAVANFSSSLYADDIEIFIKPSVEPLPPNVLFVLDESGSMSTEDAGTDTSPKTRMESLKEAMATIINTPGNENINAAIAAYTTRSSGEPPTRVIHDFRLIGENKSDFLSSIQTLTPLKSTPTIHALAASNLWYEQGYLGHPSPLDTEAKGNWCKPNLVILLSDGEPNEVDQNAYLNGTYDTSFILEYDVSKWPLVVWEIDGQQRLMYQQPVISGYHYRGVECSIDNDSNDIYNPFDDYLYLDFYNYLINQALFGEPLAHGGYCAKEIIEWGITTDLRTGGEWDWKAGTVDQNPSTRRKQTIRYYTVGMAMQDGSDRETFLKYIAMTGGGKYFSAKNADQLAEAFQHILDDATSAISYAYTAPTIPISPTNAAISGKDIFVPIFAPNPHPLWYGNIKKYQISFESATPNDPNAPKQIIIKDANNAPVMDNNGFLESSVDFWNNSAASPGLPLNGGAASQMHISEGNPRNLFTVFEESSGTPIIEDNHRIHPLNDNITAEMLGVDALSLPDSTDGQKRTMVLNWISMTSDVTLPDGNGGTVTVSHQNKMGAPIHSKPLVVSTQNESVVFITTTEGILHALNANTGKELWAFMPKDLLSTITQSFVSDWNYSKPHDEETGAPFDGHAHTTIPNYGLDGPLMTYEHEGHRYLVIGMRRGGRDYYALDITDPSQPLFAWKIEGGSSEFPKLGETWSKPIYATVQFNGDTTSTNVLIIGGGYDPKEDDFYVDSNHNGVYDLGEPANPRSDDDMGNVIYFVNPATGQRINVSGFDGVIDSVVKGHMGNAIVADILPIDINSNGVVDRLYAADVGGRIIRVDIPDHALAALTGNSQISATVLADVNLNRTGNTYSEQAGSDYQRFFNTPEAAYFNKGGTQYLAIMIGSGQQSNPLANLVDHDRFYMIKDPNVWTAPGDGTDSDTAPDYPDVIAENDLYDTTANLVQVGDSGQQGDAAYAIAASHGWYFNLNNGEKVFSSAKIYDYAVLFTTYEGVPPFTDDPCEAIYSDGTSRFYAVNMTNGSAMFSEMNGIEGTQTSDRSKIINTPGLPSTPYIITPAGDDQKLSGDILGLVGLQEVIRWPDRFHPISWEEVTGTEEDDTPPACD